MPASPTSGRERVVGCVILLAWGILVWALLDHHTKVRAATYGSADEATPSASVSDPLRLASFAPSGFRVSGSPERFDATTLSDKIDGKAELYLASEFQSLACQRFDSAPGGDPWFEWFVYDMGNARHAFAVFSLQRRPGAAASRVTELAYTGPNALFFVHGPWYMELIASDSGPAIGAALEAAARRFIEAHPAGETRLEELTLFPGAGQVAGSFTLHPSDVFGWDGLKDIFTMDYQAPSSSITAFASLRATPDEASTLADGYASFLAFNGYAPWTPEGGWPPGFTGFQAFGLYEVVFHRGRVMGGMHECSSAPDAASFARRWAEQMTAPPFTGETKAPAS